MKPGPKNAGDLLEIGPNSAADLDNGAIEFVVWAVRWPGVFCYTPDAVRAACFRGEDCRHHGGGAVSKFLGGCVWTDARCPLQPPLVCDTLCCPGVCAGGHRGAQPAPSCHSRDRPGDRLCRGDPFDDGARRMAF